MNLFSINPIGKCDGQVVQAVNELSDDRFGQIVLNENFEK